MYTDQENGKSLGKLKAKPTTKMFEESSGMFICYKNKNKEFFLIPQKNLIFFENISETFLPLFDCDNGCFVRRFGAHNK